MNDYYTNLDSPESGSKEEKLYTSTDGVSVNEYFTVSILRMKVIVYIIATCVPIAMYLWLRKYLFMFEDDGYAEFVFGIRLLLIFFFVMVIVLFWENAGKKIEVMGNSISFTQWFLIHEDITINDVRECEVITGLTSYSRYRSITYNKIVIRYGDNKKISVVDITYNNWNALARYLEYKGKASFIDGRSFLAKFFDKDI
ncbi:MAG: hypothetical protein J5517_08900 [Eubacterium sp.]|nr:hypothetical protein [Eubacterium sp.]